MNLGFARVRCPHCRHEFFVAFSCKQRCICPSCHQKRALLLAIHIAEDVCEPVAHRSRRAGMWTIPKRLRIFFRFHRHLLHRLPNLAWETVREVYRAVLGRDDLVPGGIIGIQAFGQLIHFHPHMHGLVTDGAFTPEGRFVHLPRVDDAPFLRLWEQRGSSLSPTNRDSEQHRGASAASDRADPACLRAARTGRHHCGFWSEPPARAPRKRSTNRCG